MQNPIGFAIPTQDGRATVTGAAISASQWVTASFMAYFSGSNLAGTVQLQYSNDGTTGIPNMDFTPTNWANVPGSTATATVASAATATVYVPTNFVARWYRVVWTPSGGTGNVSVTFNGLFP